MSKINGSAQEIDQPITLAGQTSVVSLFLTLGCNAQCRHCAIESSPEKAHLKLTPDEIKLALHSAKRNGMTAMQLCGGEPFIAPDLMEVSLKEATKVRLYPFLVTNASWATTPPKARAVLIDLAKLGLRHITVSYDRYHAEFVPPDRIINACQQAEQLGLDVALSVTEAELKEKQQTIEAIQPVYRLALNEDILPRNLNPPAQVGRGAGLSTEELGMDGYLTLFQCTYFVPHSGVHSALVCVYPRQLVSFCCGIANPRLTYRYPLKDDWLADMTKVWNNDQCIVDMWNRGLQSITPYELAPGMLSPPKKILNCLRCKTQCKLVLGVSCQYCFELLPKFYPDKELIDIRALL
jgi:pyruvate-formate lyase-activating enzyme